MDPNQVRLDQGDKLRRRRDRRSRGVENIRFEEKRRINQDWDYLQTAQLPNNASTDQIFNAAYKNQGLQPQNFNGPAITPNQNNENLAAERPENNSRFSKRNTNPQESTNRSWNRRHYSNSAMNRDLGVKEATPIVSILANKDLAKAEVTALNGAITFVHGPLYSFVQLPFAIISLFCAGTYYLVVEGLGVKGDVIAWWYNIGDMATLLLAVSTIIVHVLGLFILTMLFITYSAALFKPLSGSNAVLKQATFAIALLGYTIPLLSLFPWGGLVMLVVRKYPK